MRVQFIEVTGFGVRSAVITLRRKDTPLRFMLFPMVHVAAPAFYEQVRTRLASCDLIVTEGITGKSRQAQLLTTAYRFAPRRRRNGLVEQSEDGVLPSGVAWVNPDLTAAEAVGELRKLPKLTHLLLLLGAPVFGLIFALRGPSAFLDREMEVTDLPATARAEALADHPISEALLGRRDEVLLDELGRIHAARSQEPITVAVVYGAGHMPAVVRGMLTRYGYRPRGGEWLTVYLPDSMRAD